MWCIRHRLWQSGLLFIICSLVLAAGFMLQLRTLYHNHQRNLRFEEYRQTMKEISDMLSNVENVANKTSLLINRLKNVINANVQKDLHKIS